MVQDPQVVRARLLAAGATRGFAGLMLDRRYDRGGELTARDEVLRLRIFKDPEGKEQFRLGWKGPTAVTPDGYKARREFEYEMGAPRARPEQLLEALGFQVSQRIDRYVEYFHLGDTAVRLEWYPRMDVLIEVEGEETGIEAALRVIGLPRSEYTAEALVSFATRYAARTGRPPVLGLEPSFAEPPSWESR